MHSLDLLLRRIARLMAIAGGALLVVIMALSCLNIAMRALGLPFEGAFEVSGYLCAMAIGLCLPDAQLHGAHIEVGVWVKRLGSRAAAMQFALVSLVGAGVLAAVAWQMWDLALYTAESGELIEGVSFSALPMIAGFFAGIVMQLALCLFALLQAVSAPKTPETKKSQHFQRACNQSLPKPLSVEPSFTGPLSTEPVSAEPVSTQATFTQATSTQATSTQATSIGPATTKNTPAGQTPPRKEQ